MSTSIRRVAGIALVGALAVAGLPAIGQAQVVCGDTIGPNAKVTLTADLGGCTSVTSTALTIVGPATVDMAGHRILCNAMDRPEIGIALQGKGVKLSNGSIHDCGTASGRGLLVEGEGKHKVENLFVEGSMNHGVRVVSGSDKNSFKRVVVAVGDDDGWEVDGNGNKFEDVAAVGNTSDGFDLEGEGSKIKRVTVVDSGGDGLGMEGGPHKIQDAVVIGSVEDGVDVDVSSSKVDKVVAIRNGSGDPNEAGIDVSGSGNTVKKSRAYANDESGIRNDLGAQGNAISGNVALGNVTDLRDDSPGATCEGNQWKKNVFGTSNADGVLDPDCIQ